MKIRKKSDEKKESNSHIFDLQGTVNGFGIKILMDGSQWVLNAKNGYPIKRDGCDCMKTKRGVYFWFKKGETLTSIDMPHPSIWQKENI